MSTTTALEHIAAAIRACEACTARYEAAEPVPGVGPASKILIVGRNPGIQEDLNGRPFIGSAGKNLDAFLAEAGLRRERVFITNLVCCHTLHDRSPTEEEIGTCFGLHLTRYLDTLRPYLVLPLGLEVARTLLGTKRRTMANIHGKLFRHERGFYAIPCYHPAASLHNPALRDGVRFDATQVRRFLRQRRNYPPLMEEVHDHDRGTTPRDRGDGSEGVPVPSEPVFGTAD